MGQHKRFVCAAQDAFTEQFHEVPLEVYRAVQHSRHDPMILKEHCGIIDIAAKKCILFRGETISKEDYENWIAFAQSRTDNGLCHAAVFQKPSYPPKPVQKQPDGHVTVKFFDPSVTVLGPYETPTLSEDIIRQINEFKQTLMEEITRVMKEREAKERQTPPNELPNLDSLGGTGYGELGFDEFRDPNGNDGWTGN